jgi:hypothetical protein
MTHAILEPALVRLAALLLSLAATSGAVSTPVDSHRPRAAVEGTVLGVGPDTLTLRERVTGSTLAFSVAPYAAIQKDGHQVPLAQLQPGDLAQVVTDSDGREFKAIAITATTPPPKK